MLVLSRKLGERILIGNGIELKVLAVQGGRVRLGITCPNDVRILRSELIQNQTPTAAAERPAAAAECFAFIPPAREIS